MLLSDISIKRPTVAIVTNLLFFIFGCVAFIKLPLREYPDIDPPVISITTTYKGAAARVVETKITKPIEDRIAGIEGIKTISSQSEDGRSQITITFDSARTIDHAANDLRDRIAGLLKDLPEEADPSEIRKADSNDDVIIWLNLAGKGMNIMELTDYASRYIEDHFTVLDGVARVRIGGAQDMSIRVWLDRDALAARRLTPLDIENALRAENVELPAGSIETRTKNFSVRIKRNYTSLEDFRQLVIGRNEEGYIIRLQDVALVENAPVEDRALLRGNGVPMVGIGIVKQSQANTLEVATRVKEKMGQLNKELPPHISLEQSYDSSIFIEEAIKEVYRTLGITILLVIFVIYVFLGDVRTILLPAVTVPLSLMSSFIVLYLTGATINLLSLLALLLAIGLLVDDVILIIENIYRRFERGEPPLIAAYRGVRQVGFAVITTTIVLISVFLPITFLEGDIGRVFKEFTLTISTAILFSSFIALTLAPALSSKILIKPMKDRPPLAQLIDKYFEEVKRYYLFFLKRFLSKPILAVLGLITMAGAILIFIRLVPSEFTPREDRGAFFLFMRGPEGASYDYVLEYLAQVEERLMPFVETGEFQRLLLRAPGSFGTTASFHDARGIIVLSPWGSGRQPIWYYLDEVRKRIAGLPGMSFFPIVRQGLGRRVSKPVQFVLQGPTYEELTKWRDLLLAKAQENKNLLGLDHDYHETKPQLDVVVDQSYAADLGIPIATINATLETMLGSRRVTTFINQGEEYDVIVESHKHQKHTPQDIQNIYVRSLRTGELIQLSALISLTELADAARLNRYNRLRSITIEANLANGYSLGEALEYLENIARTNFPPEIAVDYRGESLDYKESSSSLYLLFILSLIVVFLVLAGQFENFTHPFIIMLTVPFAITGALFALWVTGKSLNIYSQIGLIILIGLSAKNGILIVEFINQIRDMGTALYEAILEACEKRFRPIIMTGITTAIGAVPLMLARGAGAEMLSVIGVVIFTGVIFSLILTLFIVPIMYALLAKNTQPPEATARELHKLLIEYKDINHV